MWQRPERKPHTSDRVDRQQWEVREGRKKRQGERKKEREGKVGNGRSDGRDGGANPKFYMLEYFVGTYEYKILREQSNFASRYENKGISILALLEPACHIHVHSILNATRLYLIKHGTAIEHTHGMNVVPDLHSTAQEQLNRKKRYTS